MKHYSERMIVYMVIKKIVYVNIAAKQLMNFKKPMSKYEYLKNLYMFHIKFVACLNSFESNPNKKSSHNLGSAGRPLPV